MTPSSRKFLSEFIYLPTVHVDWICRPQELAELQTVDFERPPHIYIIASLPLVTIAPDTVTFEGGSMVGTVRIQHGSEFSEHRFRTLHPSGTGWTLNSPWPHERFQTLAPNGETVSEGVVTLLGLSELALEWPLEAREFHVLYVGQAYGNDGERIAPHRLAAHSTLQRILAECPRDRQIWLMIASISDENFIVDMDGRATASTTDDEDDDHMSRLLDAVEKPPFDMSIAVSLAEAGLI